MRTTDNGELEVCIAGQWRRQNLFRVYDDLSLQAVVEIMVIRYGRSAT